MRFWRPLLAGVTVCLLASPAGVGNAATAPVLTVSGSRSASVDLVLTRDTTLDLSHMTVSGAGRFAGVYLEPLDVPPAQRERVGRNTGAIVFKDVREPGDTGHVFPFIADASAVTKAGRYRLYLLTDATAVIRVPLSGSASLRVTPTRSVAASFASDADIVSSPFQAENAQPLTVVGRRSITMSALLIGGFRAFAGDISSCVRDPGSECGSATSRGADGPYSSVGVSPLANYGLAYRVTYLPGAVAPAKYEAYQGALNVGGVQYASAAALSFQLE